MSQVQRVLFPNCSVPLTIQTQVWGSKKKSNLHVVTHAASTELGLMLSGRDSVFCTLEMQVFLISAGIGELGRPFKMTCFLKRKEVGR